MDTKELLGRRVRELRKRQKLTQEKLAELATVDLTYLGNIERGKENPTLATLEKLAGALSVPVHQILNFEHEIKGERLLKRRIAQILDNCDELQLQMILKILISIKN